MEVASNQEELASNNCFLKKNNDSFIKTTSNWKIINNKHFNDCISSETLFQAPDKTNFEDVVSLDTCIELIPGLTKESCVLEFKVINEQKIARIAVVSESSVLEFFKQSGEYATTVFSEFIDDFEDHAVYFAEAKIEPPSTEASIKFTRTKNKGVKMWIYGIKFILCESESNSTENMFDAHMITNFLANTNQKKFGKAKNFLDAFLSNHLSYIGTDMNKFIDNPSTLNCKPCKIQENNKTNEDNQLSVHKSNCNGDFSSSNPLNLKEYIDYKLENLEKRLMQRIDNLDKRTNEKLDLILRKLELNNVSVNN